MRIQWSRDPKGESRDPNTFVGEYLKNRAKWLDHYQTCTRWSPHPRYAQGQGQGQMSRDTATFVI